VRRRSVRRRVRRAISVMMIDAELQKSTSRSLDHHNGSKKNLSFSCYFQAISRAPSIAPDVTRAARQVNSKGRWTTFPSPPSPGGTTSPSSAVAPPRYRQAAPAWRPTAVPGGSRSQQRRVRRRIPLRNIITISSCREIIPPRLLARRRRRRRRRRPSHLPSRRHRGVLSRKEWSEGDRCHSTLSNARRLLYVSRPRTSAHHRAPINDHFYIIDDVISAPVHAK
jgi:hypothetical protein